MPASTWSRPAPCDRCLCRAARHGYEPNAFLPFALLIVTRLPHASVLTISANRISVDDCSQRCVRNAATHRGANIAGRRLSRHALDEANLRSAVPTLLKIIFLAGLVLQLTGALLLLTPRNLQAIALIGVGLFISLGALTWMALT